MTANLQLMKIGFACGIFDLFHAGHVLMLQECKAHCDYLIVAVNSGEHIDPSINPGKNKPLFTLKERKLILSACKYVDKVIEYHSEEELYRLLVEEHVNIRFLGDDYEGRPITGSDLPIEVYYTNRSHGLSTSKYLREIASRLTH
jgi:glycerol-3-phosphate cytidylyltransferase